MSLCGAVGCVGQHYFLKQRTENKDDGLWNWKTIEGTDSRRRKPFAPRVPSTAKCCDRNRSRSEVLKSVALCDRVRGWWRRDD